MALICSLKCFPSMMLFWSNDASQNMNPPNIGSSFNRFKGNIKKKDEDALKIALIDIVSLLNSNIYCFKT